MAIIQNSAIIQKLIDELELSPSLEKIPTELAEKILPVFQVNSEQITMTTPPANVVRSISGFMTAERVAFTTPSTGKFFLTNIHLALELCSVGDMNADNEYVIVYITPLDDVEREVMALCCDKDIVTNEKQSTNLNLQNPIPLKKGTKIRVMINGTATDGARVHLSAAGYTEAD